MSLLSSSPITGTRSSNIHHPDLGGSIHQHAAQAYVSEERLSHIAVRRLKFLARALYWAARHRSFSRGVWVSNYEGFTWN